MAQYHSRYIESADVSTHDLSIDGDAVHRGRVSHWHSIDLNIAIPLIRTLVLDQSAKLPPMGSD
jgi:hypothetical protein